MKLNLRLTLLLVLVASVFVLGWSNQRSGTPTFEYRMVQINKTDLQMDNAKLNQFGAEGWEMVTAMPLTTGDGVYQIAYFFKREKR